MSLNAWQLTRTFGILWCLNCFFRCCVYSVADESIEQKIYTDFHKSLRSLDKLKMNAVLKCIVTLHYETL